MAETFLLQPEAEKLSMENKFEYLAIADKLEKKITELVDLYNDFAAKIDNLI